jgi:hydroxymethylpyrimidine pyrophosphatase-like HAD family hydrolase
MTTLSNIKSYIDGLNPQTSTISSMGSFVSEFSEQVAQNVRNEIAKEVTPNSLAAKILATADHFSEKQLWVIAYDLLKNEEFVAKINEINAKREALENQKQQASKDKKNANKAATQNVLDYVKSEGKKLGDYYSFLKSSKKYAREFFSKKFTMESAIEFINK